MGEKMEKIFDGKKKLKLGTEKNPAIINVKTKKRMKEVAKIFEKNDWKYTIEVDRDKPVLINVSFFHGEAPFVFLQLLHCRLPIHFTTG